MRESWEGTHRVWILDSGFWILDSGVRSLDSGVWSLVSNTNALNKLYFNESERVSRGHAQSLDSRFWFLDSGFWSLDSGVWSLVSNTNALKKLYVNAKMREPREGTHRVWILDSGFWILDSGVWSLESGIIYIYIDTPVYDIYGNAKCLTNNWRGTRFSDQQLTTHSMFWQSLVVLPFLGCTLLGVTTITQPFVDSFFESPGTDKLDSKVVSTSSSR